MAAISAAQPGFIAKTGTFASETISSIANSNFGQKTANVAKLVADFFKSSYLKVAKNPSHVITAVVVAVVSVIVTLALVYIKGRASTPPAEAQIDGKGKKAAKPGK